VSFFRRSAPPEERTGFWPGYPFPPSQFAGRTTAGVNVTLETYTRSAASWACVRVLVSTVKKLPVDVVRYQGDLRKPMSPPQIVARPSALVSQRAWIAQVMRSFCSSGNVYCDITSTDYAGRPTTMETIDPGRVTWSVVGGVWTVRVDGKHRDLWPNGDLWHKPATDFLPPGRPHGLSPIEQAATSIGSAIAAENFGANFFGDGAHPTSILSSTNPNLTADQAQAAKDKLQDVARGNREPIVMGSGWDLKQYQVSPTDSQFLELLRFECEQACRWWGVPPSMVYLAVSGQNITYANATQNDLAFLKHSVDNWLVDIEDAWSELLPAPQMVKFNSSALLRMDEEARWKVHNTRLLNKTTSVNAVKALEDELPFPDPEFDKPGIPGGIDKIGKPAPIAPPTEDPTGTAT
jgi:HK97 family phage portal protein